MFPPVVGLLYLPVVIWVATGVGLLFAFRSSAPPVVLRLASTFLALWALLATTTLVWVLANGGWGAIVALAHSPLRMFDPRYEWLWLGGAAGAFIIFTMAFVLNQIVGRGFLHLLDPQSLDWPTDLARGKGRTRLMSFASGRPEAFSFTLLRLDGPRPREWHRQEIILLSRGLLDRLTAEEFEAAVAHELGHIQGLDSRYLTFMRTLARMMRWDPVLAYLAYTLTRREEYRADLAAARMTGNPLALARALFKASTLDGGEDRLGSTGFLGTGGRRGRRESMERIRRLVELAESGRFPRRPGG